MSIIHIERVDELPLILTWLMKMRISEMIDGIWQAHGQWEGLSYGQLALLFVTYIIHQRSHRLDLVRNKVMTLPACRREAC